MSEEMRTALTAPGTPDELYGTIIRLVDTGISTIGENIDWYLGRRETPPSAFVSSFYHPNDGSVMETFRLTANALIRFGRCDADLQGTLLGEAREKSLLQLALLGDLVAAVEPSLPTSEMWLLREIVRFFSYATDSFFSELETARYWWLSRLSKNFEVDFGLLIAYHAIKRFHVTFLACERKRQGLPAEPPDCSPLFKFMLLGVTRVAYPIFSAVSGTPRHKDILKLVAQISDSKDEILTAIREKPNNIGRPGKQAKASRGPKDTRMMKVQRTALITYVTIELHKDIRDVTLADAYHVWNDPENVEAWNEAAKRKDFRRGYKDYTSLYSAVKTNAEKRRLKLSPISDV